jgi:mannose/fructose-specific phosphotransferase system component IIA
MEGMARVAGLNVSLIVPAAMAKDDAKQKPAQNRRTQTAQKVSLNATPTVNMPPRSNVPT